MDRRRFLSSSAAVIAGAAVLPRTASSYENIVGANDRISLGHVGNGSRGGDLDLIASKLKSSHNVEMTAVCDLWKVNREKAVATNTGYYGRAPRAAQHIEELLAMKDVDAVLISTPEHSHSPILKMTAEAGKDAYVEKPMGNVLEEAKAARDAVLKAKTVVQVGTQHRSEPYPLTGARGGAARGTGGYQQDRDCVELSRAAVARAAGGEGDSRAGYGLEELAAAPSRRVRLIRRCILSFVCIRSFPAGFRISG